MATTKAASSPAAAGAVRNPERWIEPVRWAALVVFLAVPVVAWQFQPLAGRLVWTVVIAALPLFTVLVGYHRWRRICPLAFFSQVPTLLRRSCKRRASAWLQARAYQLSFGLFFVSLWIRLIAINGNGRAIAAFFILIALVALLFGLLYTGKTWCNYICPLSFIEKVYTEPQGLRETPNSQCPKCTACKSACPDINQENGYWREIESSSKRFVYFAYPGLIFGFYFYYYLQSGTWDYYFGGRWTNEPGVLYTAFLPGSIGPTAGFYFFPLVPRAAASALTLAVTSLISFALFSGLERRVARWQRRRDPDAEPLRVRHVLLSVTAFAAFVTFYTFAGQPTLRLVPWLSQVSGVLFVLVASLFLVRRYGRTRQLFAEETVARSLLNRWEWADLRPPKLLHDAYLVHTVRSQERAVGYTQLLEIYTESLRESLASGLVTNEEVRQLEALRGRLQIKPADHERIMAALAEEDRSRLTDPARQVSVEKQLQIKTYTRALERHLGRVLSAEDRESGAAAARLQAEHGVTPEEHAAVLEQILSGAHAVAARIAEEVRVVERSSRTIAALRTEPSPVTTLLADLARSRRDRAIDRVLIGLNFAAGETERRAIREGLTSEDSSGREAAFESLCAAIPRSIADRLRAARAEEAACDASASLPDRLLALTESPDPYTRAAAVHALAAGGKADRKVVERLAEDDHPLVRATAQRALGGAGPVVLFGIDRILALRAVPIFSRVAVEGLARLAESSVEATVDPGQILCREGEPGGEVFVMLDGEVDFVRGTGPSEERLGKETAGGVIGEMAVLDPAPRAATVRAGPLGARVLRLDGAAFRDTLEADPTVADGVIRVLARRLRRAAS